MKSDNEAIPSQVMPTACRLKWCRDWLQARPSFSLPTPSLNKSLWSKTRLLRLRVCLRDLERTDMENLESLLLARERCEREERSLERMSKM